ncbi:MAG: hypothetical protein M1824_003736 [Vezdaea acicularis]|nr:MAG: hypothetical protein M1824_003736 [Vezdaea acicularis]
MGPLLATAIAVALVQICSGLPAEGTSLLALFSLATNGTNIIFSSPSTTTNASISIITLLSTVYVQATTASLQTPTATPPHPSNTSNLTTVLAPSSYTSSPSSIICSECNWSSMDGTVFWWVNANSTTSLRTWFGPEYLTLPLPLPFPTPTSSPTSIPPITLSNPHQPPITISSPSVWVLFNLANITYTNNCIANSTSLPGGPLYNVFPASAFPTAPSLPLSYDNSTDPILSAAYYGLNSYCSSPAEAVAPAADLSPDQVSSVLLQEGCSPDQAASIVQAYPTLSPDDQQNALLGC